jgi:hypothetical protein
MANPLDALAESPEALIVQKWFDVQKADSILSSSFNPIMLIESATAEAFKGFAINSMAVMPGQLRFVDHPSDRQTIYIPIVSSLYLPTEPTNEMSLLRGLDLGNHIRKLAYSNTELTDTTAGTITFGAVDFAVLPTLTPKVDSPIRILRYGVTFSTDIVPTTGAFD